MHRPLAFGRPHEQEDARASCKLVNPWPQRCRDLGETGGSTSGRCVCRKAGACAYSAVVEASRFRAEATRKQQRRRPLLQREGARSGWDCGSSLYDSFELNAFSNELGHCLAEELRCNEATARAPLLAAPPPMSRRSTGCNPQFKLPACFPIPRNILPSCFGGERPRPIQLGKRKKPSMHEAFHRVSKAARRCFAFAWSQAGLDHQHAQVYHHHMHHYSLQRAVGDVDDGTNGSMVAAKLLKNFQEEEARACLSPRTLAALRGEINRRQRTSIKYHG